MTMDGLEKRHARLAPQPAAPAGGAGLGRRSAAPPSAAKGTAADRQIARGIAGGVAAKWGGL